MSEISLPRDRSPIERVAVVVPAHDEERLLPACLAALEAASAEVNVEVTVMVVLDACTDSSSRLIPPTVATMSIAARSVGAARRAGFAALLNPDTDPHTWFATTDADSEVPPDWIVCHLASAGAGADAFVGTVTPKDWDTWPPELAPMFAERYGADESHYHVHGANLGFRAELYRRVGGFAARTGDEDVDLVRRLASAGARVHRSSCSPVQTSTRRDGRADSGFAAYLHRLEIVSQGNNRRARAQAEVIR